MFLELGLPKDQDPDPALKRAQAAVCRRQAALRAVICAQLLCAAREVPNCVCLIFPLPVKYHSRVNSPKMLVLTILGDK